MRIIINNAIYDITTFINEHPGGLEVFRNHSKPSDNVGGGGMTA
jgi:cytochrome b involved in lipid metabolism